MIIRFALIVLAILIASYFVPGIEVDGLYTSVIVATLLGIANITLKPILTLLMFPIHILTLGLSALFINVGIFWLLSSFIEGFAVSGFFAAILGSLIVAVTSAFASLLT